MKGAKERPVGWTHSPCLAAFGLSRGIPKKDWPHVQAEDEVTRRDRLDPHPDPRLPQWMSHPCHLHEIPYLCVCGIEDCPDVKYCLFQRLREYNRISQTMQPIQEAA